MDGIADLDFSAYDDNELLSRKSADVWFAKKVLCPENICGGPASIIQDLLAGAVYIDPVMGVIVSTRGVCEQISTDFKGFGRQLSVGNNAVVEPPSGGAAMALPRFWYIKRLGGWPCQTGIGQTVAVIDTGLDGRHRCHLREKPDLDFTSIEAGEIETIDAGGHGTNCGGLIAARSHCSERIGVAPDCRLVVGKMRGVSKYSVRFSVEWVLLVSWALHCRGARIFSFSYGARAQDINKMMGVNIYSTIATRLRQQNAGIIFCAAGDAGEHRYPGAAPGIIAVGGYNPMPGDPCRIVADTDYGEIDSPIWANSELILGPCVGMTTTAQFTDPGGSCSTRDDFRGLSPACAFVAGVAALYLESYPGRTLDQVIAQMFADAEDVPHPTDKSRTFKGIRFPRIPNRSCC